MAGQPITLKDVDAKWEAFDAAERARVVQAMYQNRRNMLEQLVGDRLIENAAKAAGQTPEAFVAADPLRPQTFTRPGEKIGRNDLCPCGSGKKFKKCCQKP